MTPENFNELLAWLGTDSTGGSEDNRGAIKYEAIRSRIIKIYRNRGCPCAEEIADETADRVCKKAEALISIYEGDPALYFYAVAKRVYFEWLRDQARVPPASARAPLLESDPGFVVEWIWRLAPC